MPRRALPAFEIDWNSIDISCREKWARDRKLFGGAVFVGDPITKAADQVIALRNYFDEAERQCIDTGGMRASVEALWRHLQMIHSQNERKNND